MRLLSAIVPGRAPVRGGVIAILLRPCGGGRGPIDDLRIRAFRAARRPTCAPRRKRVPDELATAGARPEPAPLAPEGCPGTHGRFIGPTPRTNCAHLKKTKPSLGIARSSTSAPPPLRLGRRRSRSAGLRGATRPRASRSSFVRSPPRSALSIRSRATSRVDLADVVNGRADPCLRDGFRATWSSSSSWKARPSTATSLLVG